MLLIYSFKFMCAILPRSAIKQWPSSCFTGDGSVLHTLVLRPTIMYGELDPWYVVSGLRAARRRGGILLPVGDGRARLQVSYAGNVAWAHLCALLYYAHLCTPVHLYILFSWAQVISQHGEYSLVVLIFAHLFTLPHFFYLSTVPSSVPRSCTNLF